MLYMHWGSSFEIAFLTINRFYPVKITVQSIWLELILLKVIPVLNPDPQNGRSPMSGLTKMMLLRIQEVKSRN